MRRIAVIGILVVAALEAMALRAGAPAASLIAVGASAAVVIFAMRRTVDAAPAAGEIAVPLNSQEEMLRRWRLRTETLVSWADGSCADWDRHLRPLLAREFVHVSGPRAPRGHAEIEAAGAAMFGAALWRWVDPAGARTGDPDGPGPGRGALERILTRLEQL
ncbi:hypothetical protein FCG67_16580 [Rhodococcus oryzae]|uniref:Uncharacterized protein n=1 Tax=Rhodococcus oryzae TaxID=2571143 RepID=A0ABY2RI45_9NOCA|nr:hypothetical protein [Rhodococcus oryzae]TJZ76835.1 hypothetical protein FCG67_16580 [Rhodococcus oryzae]